MHILCNAITCNIHLENIPMYFHVYIYVNIIDIIYTYFIPQFWLDLVIASLYLRIITFLTRTNKKKSQNCGIKSRNKLFYVLTGFHTFF